MIITTEILLEMIADAKGPSVELDTAIDCYINDRIMIEGCVGLTIPAGQASRYEEPFNWDGSPEDLVSRGAAIPEGEGSAGSFGPNHRLVLLNPNCRNAPRYSESVDIALTTIPSDFRIRDIEEFEEGWNVSLHPRDRAAIGAFGDCVTLPLAIIEASIYART